METGTISEYLKFFAALLAIVNPVGVIPIFIMFFQYPIRLRWGKIRGRGFGGNYVFPKI